MSLMVVFTCTSSSLVASTAAAVATMAGATAVGFAASPCATASNFLHTIRLHMKIGKSFRKYHLIMFVGRGCFFLTFLYLGFFSVSVSVLFLSFKIIIFCCGFFAFYLKQWAHCLQIFTKLLQYFSVFHTLLLH